MLAYSIAGALAGAAAVLLVLLCRAKGLKGGRFAGAYALMLLGVLAIVFSIDWGYASFIEGEPQAAAIGFLVFGGIGAVLAIIGARLTFAKPKEKVPETASAQAVVEA